ncbi:MAG: ATP-binding cassette domain-containing protein [Clostridiales bacterium]|nr:ATP-binding cassette domain-containing protein [Clostridiales bacterium]
MMQIKTEALGRKYGDKYALRDVTLELGSGVYGLLGPNGAGKSTLINILVGNLQQTAGKVVCDGRDIRGYGRDYRKRLGYMPQQQNLYPGFTGWEFLAYMAVLKEVPRETIRVKISAAARQVNLQDELKKKLHAYSGGMRQRILLAAAILNDPELLILDEPTAGLDPRERIRIRNLVSSISKDKIVLIATHVVSDIEHISKEIILLGDGRLIRKAGVGELTHEIRDYVYEITVPAEQIPRVESAYCVSNILSDGSVAKLKVLAEQPLQEYENVHTIPTLEDVYLYHFQMKDRGPGRDETTVF